MALNDIHEQLGSPVGNDVTHIVKELWATKRNNHAKNWLFGDPGGRHYFSATILINISTTKIIVTK